MAYCGNVAIMQEFLKNYGATANVNVVFQPHSSSDPSPLLYLAWSVFRIWDSFFVTCHPVRFDIYSLNESGPVLQWRSLRHIMTRTTLLAAMIGDTH